MDEMEFEIREDTRTYMYTKNSESEVNESVVSDLINLFIKNLADKNSLRYTIEIEVDKVRHIISVKNIVALPCPGC
ncbi:MAG TPA: hypothetical protein VK436_09445 [Methanocella sp.]|nr:hypothetical protein [Methanocella sp.]